MQTLTSTYYCILSIFFVCGFSNATNAQNLVPNGGFEEGITCPSFVGNLTDECEHWYASIFSENGQGMSPEWFHECSEFENFTPPSTGFGFQFPYEGEGFAGLSAYRATTENTRELIGVELSNPLIVGEIYLVEYMASNMYFPDLAAATNKLGFNFSTHPNFNISAFPTNTSHYWEESIIPVSEEWFEISSFFTADSAYQYFHIGNFFDDENTEAVLDGPNSNSTYYAIDDVSVSITTHTLDKGLGRDNLTIFPNPASEILTIKLSDVEKISEIHLFDYTGLLLLSESYHDYNSVRKLNISPLPSGVYTMQVITPKSKYYEKIIKL